MARGRQALAKYGVVSGRLLLYYLDHQDKIDAEMSHKTMAQEKGI